MFVYFIALVNSNFILILRSSQLLLRHKMTVLLTNAPSEF